MFDLRPPARASFAALWVLGQAAMVLTAGLRSDHIFAFRMFSEASTLEIHLSRDTKDFNLPAPRGEWAARDHAGQLRHFSWRDRVRDPVLESVDVPMFASYGLDAQLARLRHALDDVADNIEEDNETRRLRADVLISKNGREPTTVTLLSHVRRER
jgi:hypothetical protein